MENHEDVVESMRKNPAYIESMELLAKRKELQATIRQINSALRTLQHDASALVNLAKADLRSEEEALAQHYSILQSPVSRRGK